MGRRLCLKKPRTAKRQEAIVDWGFNAWGGKYPPYDDDDAVPTEIAEEMGLPVFILSRRQPFRHRLKPSS